MYIYINIYVYIYLYIHIYIYIYIHTYLLHEMHEAFFYAHLPFLPRRAVHYRALPLAVVRAMKRIPLLLFFFFFFVPFPLFPLGASNVLVISTEECARSRIMFAKMLLKMSAHGRPDEDASMLKSRVHEYTRDATLFIAPTVIADTRVYARYHVRESRERQNSLITVIRALSRSTIQAHSIETRHAAATKQPKVSWIYSTSKRGGLSETLCYVQNV